MVRFAVRPRRKLVFICIFHIITRNNDTIVTADEKPKILLFRIERDRVHHERFVRCVYRIIRKKKKKKNRKNRYFFFFRLCFFIDARLRRCYDNDLLLLCA